jgi:hypothetical protein
MPRKKKSDAAPELQAAAVPKISKELLDQLITGPITQGEFETIFRALKKCNDPVKTCSGINLRGFTDGYIDGRRDQAVDSAT